MWSMVALDSWSPYTVTIVWQFAWAYSTLFVLYEWSSYRGGRLNRLDCTLITSANQNELDEDTLIAISCLYLSNVISYVNCYLKSLKSVHTG